MLADTPGQSSASLWRNRDRPLLWSGQPVSAAGTRVSLLAFPLVTLAVTGSPAQAGLISAARGGPSTLLALPAGALIDRRDRKRTMLVCDLGRAMVLGGIAVAVLGGSVSLLLLALAALIEGALSTFFALAESACLPRVVPSDQVAAAAAADQASGASAELVGPAIGGALFGVGPGMPFLADALSYLVSFASLLGMRTPLQEVRRSPAGVVASSIRREVIEGASWVWQEPLIRFLGLLHGGVDLCGFGYTLILIVIAKQQGATPFETGLVLGAGGGAAAVGSVLVAPLVGLVGRGWCWRGHPAVHGHPARVSAGQHAGRPSGAGGECVPHVELWSAAAEPGADRGAARADRGCDDSVDPVPAAGPAGGRRRTSAGAWAANAAPPWAGSVVARCHVRARCTGVRSRSKSGSIPLGLPCTGGAVEHRDRMPVRDASVHLLLD